MKEKLNNMDKEKELNKTSAIEGKFNNKADNKDEEFQKTQHPKTNQTNPLYNRLYKLAHHSMDNPLNKYIPFSKFKPDDLK